MVVCLQKSDESPGQIRIISDNYSVVTILKDQIFAQANSRNIQLSIESDLRDGSVLHVLSLLHPLVQEQYDIASQNQLILGLKELQVNVSLGFVIEAGT